MVISRVLLVDDEEDIRLVAGMSLTKLTAWQVLAASSGHEALRLARQFNPDVVLLDVMMPKLDGPETLRLLRAQGSLMPVVFLTAKVLKAEQDLVMSLGACGVISKPFDPLTLAKQVSALVDGAA